MFIILFYLKLVIFIILLAFNQYDLLSLNISNYNIIHPHYFHFIFLSFQYISTHHLYLIHLTSPINQDKKENWQIYNHILGKAIHFKVLNDFLQIHRCLQKLQFAEYVQSQLMLLTTFQLFWLLLQIYENILIICLISLL